MTKSPAERGHRFQPKMVENYEGNGRPKRKFRVQAVSFARKKPQAVPLEPRRANHIMK
jgi:hypothetical protein